MRKIDPSGTISTIAGNGTRGFSGDGGQATSAALNFPIAVAIDGAGNVLIADRDNDRIRRVTPAGIMSTIAGDGIRGFGSDSVLATSTHLNRPVGIIFNSAGNLMIADAGNSRVRKVSTQGIITTIAGDGNYGVNPNGLNGDGGAATSAALYSPSGLAFDAAGNLFIADSNAIRKVSASGVIGTVVAQYAADVVVDGAGNLFFTNDINGLVYKKNSAGSISVVAGGGNPYPYIGDFGPATSALLTTPAGLAIDGSGQCLHCRRK